MKILCRSIPKTFRRAGITFTREAAEHEVDEATLEVLQAEPALVVEHLLKGDTAEEAPTEEKPGSVKETGKDRKKK